MHDRLQERTAQRGFTNRRAVLHFETHILLAVSSTGQKGTEEMITSAIKEWLALIKRHRTEPTGDEKGGRNGEEFSPFCSSAGSSGPPEPDVASPDVDKWSNYIYVSA